MSVKGEFMAEIYNHGLGTKRRWIRLADIPKVDEFTATGFFVSGGSLPICFSGDDAKTRRYAEIMLHLAAVKRALLEELVDEK